MAEAVQAETPPKPKPTTKNKRQRQPLALLLKQEWAAEPTCFTIDIPTETVTVGVKVVPSKKEGQGPVLEVGNRWVANDRNSQRALYRRVEEDLIVRRANVRLVKPREGQSFFVLQKGNKESPALALFQCEPESDIVGGEVIVHDRRSGVALVVLKDDESVTVVSRSWSVPAYAVVKTAEEVEPGIIKLGIRDSLRTRLTGVGETLRNDRVPQKVKSGILFGAVAFLKDATEEEMDLILEFFHGLRGERILFPELCRNLFEVLYEREPYLAEDWRPNANFLAKSNKKLKGAPPAERARKARIAQESREIRSRMQSPKKEQK